MIRFETAHLADVCKFLSEYYKVDLGVEKGLEDDKITTVFDNLTLGESIGIISNRLDLQVQKNGSSFVLTEQ